jgi:high affinity Mn2+ porin
MIRELIFPRTQRAIATTAAAATACALASPLAAADLPVKAPRALAVVYDWTGFYVGGHVGYGSGSFGPGANGVLNYGVALPASITGLTGGFQGGYRTQFANRVVLGAEGEVTFPDAADLTKTHPRPYETTFDVFGSARVTAGYSIGAWLPYVTAGLAWGRTHITVNDLDGLTPLVQRHHVHVGWTAGAGVELAIDGPWSARLQYDYVDLETRNFNVETAPGGTLNVTPRFHEVKAGLNYKLFMPTAQENAKGNAIDELKQPSSGNWNVHAQTTFLEQAYPSFRSPYVGPNSLSGTGQGRETWTTTAFLGWRVWDGGEVYFNPEADQGFGLNSTHGLAGFSNGEAQKGGAPFPRVRAMRYFLRQTFGLGGAQEDVADGPNQLPGKRDIDRVTLTVGRIAINDIFDANSYAHDSRADFMNWALWESAAFDMPADLPGFTRGAVVELNRKDWAVRAGAFEVPSEPNSDTLSFRTVSTIAEVEERHSILGQPGKLRIGGFANRSHTANFSDVFAALAADPTLDTMTATTLARRQNWRYGFYANLEQQIVQDVGVFARASWNDGRSESVSFTDTDRSLSGGVSIKGSFWGRKDDTVGIGAAVNALSAPHRAWFAAGGLGLLIGDGQLNYRTEDIFEAYYAWVIQKGLVTTFDYQFIANPAYNADRGPVSIFSARVHAEW